MNATDDELVRANCAGWGIPKLAQHDARHEFTEYLPHGNGPDAGVGLDERDEGGRSPQRARHVLGDTFTHPPKIAPYKAQLKLINFSAPLYISLLTSVGVVFAPFSPRSRALLRPFR